MATASFNLAPGETSSDALLRRKLAIQQLQEGASGEPVRAWTQGAARLANALIGGMELANEDAKEEKEKTEGRQQMLAFLSGAGGTAPQAAPSSAMPGKVESAPLSPVAPAVAAPPMGKLPALGTRIYAENEFNPMDAAVATPTELAAGVNAPPKYAALIGKAAVDNDLPPNLLAAQLRQESGFNPNAVSRAGASGISQFMPDTARDMGVTDPTDPTQAIPAGARYLRQNIDRFGGDVPTGLAAYNAGPGRVERAGGDISKLPAETQGYVANITQAARAPVANPAAPTAPVAPGTAAASNAAGGLSPEGRAQLVAMLQNKYTAPMAQAIIGQIVTQQLAPKESTWGEVGVDPYGNKVMGWINSRTKSVEPVPVPGTGTQTAGAAPPPKDIAIPAPPPGADPKKWRETFTENAAKNTAGNSLPGTSAEATSMRKEMQDLPSYKNLSAAAPIYKSMAEAAGRDTRAADLNLVYGLAKIMDPTSVVREGEITLAQATATLPQQLRAAIESQLTGEGRLSPEVREAMMQEAHGRMQAYSGMYQQDMDQFRGIAERNRLNPDDVIRNFGAFDPWKRAPAAGAAPSAAAVTAPGSPTLRLDPATGTMVPR